MAFRTPESTRGQRFRRQKGALGSHRLRGADSPKEGEIVLGSNITFQKRTMARWVFGKEASGVRQLAKKRTTAVGRGKMTLIGEKKK